MFRPLRFALLGVIAGSFLCMGSFAGRMTGGGSIFQNSLRITHGFELHCSLDHEAPPAGPNNLQVNWAGNRFHMERIIFGVCTDEGDADPPKNTPFTTYDGAGWGRYNGVTGARISWRFTDFGEPGRNDQIVRLTIVNAEGQVVLDAGPASLTFGNHQAHK